MCLFFCSLVVFKVWSGWDYIFEFFDIIVELLMFGNFGFVNKEIDCFGGFFVMGKYIFWIKCKDLK